ncbi:hypothetical protein DH2020_023960 [Rehmannia glutinosa]|uniref:BHLH domain-containing protein n=1 Tax=Rehmannia glutinosa TaxID=99300 RepID=A0ABR0W7I2_REHGL
MEGVVGTIPEGGWNNFISDEADFMAQLLGNCSIPNHDHVQNNASNFAISSVFWPCHESNNSNNVVGVDESTYSFSQGVQQSYYPSVSHHHHFLMNNSNNNFVTMDYCNRNYNNVIEEDHDEYLLNGQDVSNESTMVSDDHHKLSEDVFQEKISLHLGKRREKSIQEVQLMIKEDKSSSVSEKYSRKRPRIPTGEKRRERINERLRILQSLVPNGTKVDISTMLEEAVQYVKFLQLQIKVKMGGIYACGEFFNNELISRWEPFINIEWKNQGRSREVEASGVTPSSFRTFGAPPRRIRIIGSVQEEFIRKRPCHSSLITRLRKVGIFVLNLRRERFYYRRTHQVGQSLLDMKVRKKEMMNPLLFWFRTHRIIEIGSIGTNPTAFTARVILLAFKLKAFGYATSHSRLSRCLRWMECP